MQTEPIPEDKINTSNMIIVKSTIDKFDMKIFELIFSQPTEHSYYVLNHWWYVVRYNEGYWIHYRFLFSKKILQIQYTISSELHINPLL